ncbi:IS3 family transposase [Providencia rettgeri]|nr:IS3 family transposase [Providencia rettgeri]EIJ7169114.1 IS3 family transposase [Providencia rettgeri]EJD6048619.1 IS3 family transposase [Providencia rettgeri]ELH9585938.1 IS3 family transposase [Providencia rettgeri]ELM3939673.1 IS3 family transposase [Providencia rettgeri]
MIGYLNNSHANHKRMKRAVLDYLRYYNLTQLHTTNNYLSPVAYEDSFRKDSEFCCIGWKQSFLFFN